MSRFPTGQETKGTSWGQAAIRGAEGAVFLAIKSKKILPFRYEGQYFFSEEHKYVLRFFHVRKNRMIILNEQGELEGGGYMRVEVIAKLFSVTVRRVQQLTQEGVIQTVEVNGEGRRYDLVQTLINYIQYLSDKAYGKNKSEKETELKRQKLEAEIALKESQGEIHRIKAEIAAGKYIDVEEVALDYQKFFVTFKRFVLGIPSRLVSMISDSLEPLEARRVEKEMSAEVKRMLRAFVVSGCTQDLGEKKTRKRCAKT